MSRASRILAHLFYNDFLVNPPLLYQVAVGIKAEKLSWDFTSIIRLPTFMFMW